MCFFDDFFADSTMATHYYTSSFEEYVFFTFTESTTKLIEVHL